MTTKAYDEYLQSVGWKRRRATKMRVDGRWVEDGNGNRVFVCCDRCESFGYPRSMHIHHKTYERVGNELFSDLEILCQICHSAEHGIPFDVQITPTRAHENEWMRRRRIKGW